MPKRMSPTGRQMLIELEGVRDRVYYDVAGFATIGVGHMLTQDELHSGKIQIGDRYVRYGDGLTDEQIDDLLEQDLAHYEAAVEQMAGAYVNQHQFDALVSFAFNVGVNALRRSTLLKKVLRGEFGEIPGEFRRWIYSGGRTWDGLVSRREAEIARWSAPLAPDSVRA